MSLRNIIETECQLLGLPMDNLTVLSSSRDPYRLDTPANHRLGKWLSEAYQEVNPYQKKTHLRGLHYMLVGRVIKPDGMPYINDDAHWLWLSEKAAKAARWLGYLPWELIRDARNAEPKIFTPEFQKPEWRIDVADVYLMLPDDLEPRFKIRGDIYRQPYRQVVIAEKQGVEDVLLSVCREYAASLVLPSGEISDSLVYEVLKAANDDGRPLVVHQLGDFDPAGNQMAVSTARKMQALRDSLFPEMDVMVNAIGLTLEQCRQWNLPSTPLKDTERRADKWMQATGWQQTELDAAVALVPDQFQKMVADALEQYYDSGLEHKALNEKERLEDQANIWLADMLDAKHMLCIREQIEGRLAELQNEVDAVNDALMIDTRNLKNPDELIVTFGNANPTFTPLLDTRLAWSISTQRMLARKQLVADAENNG